MAFPLTSFTVIPRNDRQREPAVYQETAERALRDFGPSAAGLCPVMGIEAGPDPDFQDTTAGLRNDPPPVFDEPAVGYGQMGEAWQDMIAIQRHECRPR